MARLCLCILLLFFFSCSEFLPERFNEHPIGDGSYVCEADPSMDSGDHMEFEVQGKTITGSYFLPNTEFTLANEADSSVGQLGEFSGSYRVREPELMEDDSQLLIDAKFYDQIDSVGEDESGRTVRHINASAFKKASLTFPIKGDYSSGFRLREFGGWIGTTGYWIHCNRVDSE